MVDYDQLTVGTNPSYFVGFDYLEVGRLLGQGLVSCVSDWHVSKPEVAVLKQAIGDDAETAYQGYLRVLQPLFRSGRFLDAANPAPATNPAVGLSEFEAAYATNPLINAALVPDDETAALIISHLQTTADVRPFTFPITGDGATLAGLDNVIAGYQCGTAYEPIYREAQVAVALAIYLRADKHPPATLANQTTTVAGSHATVPSVLVSGEWITGSNIKTTVLRDGSVSASQLCAAAYAAACRAAGIDS